MGGKINETGNIYGRLKVLEESTIEISPKLRGKRTNPKKKAERIKP